MRAELTGIVGTAMCLVPQPMIAYRQRLQAVAEAGEPEALSTVVVAQDAIRGRGLASVGFGSVEISEPPTSVGDEHQQP